MAEKRIKELEEALAKMEQRKDQYRIELQSVQEENSRLTENYSESQEEIDRLIQENESLKESMKSMDVMHVTPS